MKKLLTITPEHFDAAVAQKWSVETCLLQQATNFRLYTDSAVGNYRFNLPESFLNVMWEFDCFFLNPGDEKGESLQKLRASLPISGEVEEII